MYVTVSSLPKQISGSGVNAVLVAPQLALTPPIPRRQVLGARRAEAFPDESADHSPNLRGPEASEDFR